MTIEKMNYEEFQKLSGENADAAAARVASAFIIVSTHLGDRLTDAAVAALINSGCPHLAWFVHHNRGHPRPEFIPEWDKLTTKMIADMEEFVKTLPRFSPQESNEVLGRVIKASEITR